MRFMLLAAPLALALAACGGGGGGGTATQTAALQGMVYEVDGQTLDRSGVTVRVLETGQSATTGADGRFFFTRVPADAFTLDFNGGLAALAQSGPGGGGADDPVGDDNGGGGGGTDDPLGDDNGGGGNGADDPPGDDNGSGGNGSDDLTEDDNGNPQVGGVPNGDTVEVRVAVDNGQVVEMSVSGSDRVRAESRLQRAAGSPDTDVQGKVRVESRADREKFTIEAEHLDAGTVVEFFLDGASIGSATADATGEAKLELATNDGAVLPLGKATAADLSGLPVEVRLAGGGATLLTGEVPALPDGTVTPGDPGAVTDRSRGRAPLAPLVSGLEGHVEIRRRPDEQRFKMEAQGLASGTAVAFWIADTSGTFVRLGGATAGATGDVEVSTQDNIAMPLGVSDVADLVGLSVRRK